ncbi:intraflagellar transport protein 20 homolog [Oppia nitens]|uniref:intraflagellar transport protein 20 homolog n=1 Tax=Oppia nitens TaxID=1686743 RepID=UPI0023DB119C|nr:intraflagellar transport protein 20 homolog [Oppia nitens]
MNNITKDQFMLSVGLYIDESNKICIIDPQLTDKSSELKNESIELIDKTQQFQQIVDNFVEIIENLAKDVENARINAIGSRNLLKTFQQKHESDVQQLMSLIKEKKNELNRFRVQYDSLKREESEQIDLMDNLLANK